MESFLNFLFSEDERVRPRWLVGAGLLAFFFNLFWQGGNILTGAISALCVIACVSLMCYAGLRVLLPQMNPRNPDSDVLVVYGTAVLMVFTGLSVFGWIFFLSIGLGGALLWQRAPDLFENVPGLHNAAE